MFHMITAITVAGMAKTVNGVTRIYPRPVHQFAIGIDIAAALALLIVGVCAVQGNFMSIGASYTLLGAGSSYTFIALLKMIFLIKSKYAPNRYLIK